MLLSQWLTHTHSHTIFQRLAKALTRLRVCAGWSEPILVAHTTLLESHVAAHLIAFMVEQDGL